MLGVGLHPNIPLHRLNIIIFITTYQPSQVYSSTNGSNTSVDPRDQSSVAGVNNVCTIRLCELLSQHLIAVLPKSDLSYTRVIEYLLTPHHRPFQQASRYQSSSILSLGQSISPWPLSRSFYLFSYSCRHHLYANTSTSPVPNPSIVYIPSTAATSTGRGGRTTEARAQYTQSFVHYTIHHTPQAIHEAHGQQPRKNHALPIRVQPHQTTYRFSEKPPNDSFCSGRNPGFIRSINQ